MKRRVAALSVAIAAGGLLTISSPSAIADTGVSVPGTVSAGRSTLALRAAPTTDSLAVDWLPTGTELALVCSEPGPRIVGRVRSSERWNRLTNGRYVSDAYVKRTRSVPACPPPGTGDPVSSATIVMPDGATAAGLWVAPVPGRGTSGFRTVSRPEHDGIDLMAPRNTPIRTVSSGTVVTVRCNTSGPSCDVDGGPHVRGCGWYVEVRHAGNLTSRYCHMIRRPEVSVGQQVVVGQTIGFVGNSGHSSGPHLHFEIHHGAGAAARHNAIDPADFMRRAGAPIT